MAAKSSNQVASESDADKKAEEEKAKADAEAKAKAEQESADKKAEEEKAKADASAADDGSANVTNHHKGPLSINGVTIPPGKTARVEKWGVAKENKTVAAWLKAKVISAE